MIVAVLLSNSVPIVAMIAMTPLITIQVLGLIGKTKQDKKLRQLKLEFAQIDDEKIKKIENLIDFFQENLPKITNFIIYGENELSAICHVCRAVCRRAEREIITVNQQYNIDTNVITYINRLSDFLFVLARVYTKNEEKSDFLWKK